MAGAVDDSTNLNIVLCIIIIIIISSSSSFCVVDYDTWQLALTDVLRDAWKFELCIPGASTPPPTAITQLLQPIM